jgi:hypothetical protein
MGFLRQTLDNFLHPESPYSWAAPLTDQVDNAPYRIVQSGAGQPIEERPSLAEVPNGFVEWLLYDAPGSSNGPDDVEDHDLVFNISGTVW